MRIIKFPKYDENAAAPDYARAWAIMWLGVNNYPAGNREQTLTGNKVWQALREASEKVGENFGEETRRLKPQGAEIVFEDAEFRLLTLAIEKIREQIRLSNSDSLLWIDHQLEKAPEVSKETYKKSRKPVVELVES